MVKRGLVCLLAVLFALSMAGMAVAAEKFKGSVTAAAAKSVTVKDAEGKEMTFKISSKRTAFKGIGSASELKEGQNVSVTYDGEEASQISVK